MLSKLLINDKFDKIKVFLFYIIRRNFRGFQIFSISIHLIFAELTIYRMGSHTAVKFCSMKFFKITNIAKITCMQKCHALQYFSECSLCDAITSLEPAVWTSLPIKVYWSTVQAYVTVMYSHTHAIYIILTCRKLLTSNHSCKKVQQLQGPMSSVTCIQL